MKRMKPKPKEPNRAEIEALIKKYKDKLAFIEEPLHTIPAEIEALNEVIIEKKIEDNTKILEHLKYKKDILYDLQKLELALRVNIDALEKRLNEID